MTPYRDASVPRTAITRTAAQSSRLRVTIALLAAVSAGFAISVSLGWVEDAFLGWMGAGLSACGAIGMLLGNLRGGTGDAPCPVCGATLRNLERTGKREGIRCAKCNTFLQTEDGVVRPMALDTIADQPIFSAVLPTPFQFPPGCVVCGAPAMQDLPVSAERTVGIQTTFIKIQVPHCAAHDDGATAHAGGDGFYIMFRSYPYQRSFCELNQTR